MIAISNQHRDELVRHLNALQRLPGYDLTEVRNILLIHLSDSNSNERHFVEEITALTGKPTYAASAGMKMNINLLPY